MVINTYLSMITLNSSIKKKQQDVLGFLEANKIGFEEKDIAANEENRKWMRENVPENNRPATGYPLPPQIFNESQYRGDYDAFFEARENNAVYAFLGLTAPPGSKREAETQAEGEAGSTHREPDVGFDPGSPGSRPGPKAGAKPLRHPGIPRNSF
ncbi:unnamed protein product [Nyctereutes procyonoides]|uniref:SH3 domain-binding glutamic acid-rich-like protein 1 n=1 Tax=Nyctereutes procyonoides TaxID=34880 RepID=A0A811Z4F5_NYCPR|nr:unnamed protein product [Nyctereutes procyonoides]